MQQNNQNNNSSDALSSSTSTNNTTSPPPIVLNPVQYQKQQQQQQQRHSQLPLSPPFLAQQQISPSSAYAAYNPQQQQQISPNQQYVPQQQSFRPVQMQMQPPPPPPQQPVIYFRPAYTAPTSYTPIQRPPPPGSHQPVPLQVQMQQHQTRPILQKSQSYTQQGRPIPVYATPVDPQQRQLRPPPPPPFLQQQQPADPMQLNRPQRTVSLIRSGHAPPSGPVQAIQSSGNPYQQPLVFIPATRSSSNRRPLPTPGQYLPGNPQQNQQQQQPLSRNIAVQNGLKVISPVGGMGLEAIPGSPVEPAPPTPASPMVLAVKRFEDETRALSLKLKALTKDSIPPTSAGPTPPATATPNSPRLDATHSEVSCLHYPSFHSYLNTPPLTYLDLLQGALPADAWEWESTVLDIPSPLKRTGTITSTGGSSSGSSVGASVTSGQGSDSTLIASSSSPATASATSATTAPSSSKSRFAKSSANNKVTATAATATAAAAATKPSKKHRKKKSPSISLSPFSTYSLLSTSANTVASPTSSLPSIAKQQALDIDKALKSSSDPRSHVMANLFETERNYLKDLETLQNVFRERIRKCTTRTACQLIFGGVDELHAFHQKFYTELEDLLFSWNDTTCIGDLFLRHKEEFAVYKHFMTLYAPSQAQLRHEEKNNEQFRTFMKECLSNPVTKRQQLRDFLVLPVQRAMRYHLLLKDLRKYTPETHPDYPLLTQALAEMHNMASMVNDSKREEEETTAMFTAFEQTKYCPPILISAKRRLVYQVDVQETKSIQRGCHLFLFSDLLMITLLPKASKTKLLMDFNTDYGSGGSSLVGGLGLGEAAVYKFFRWLDLWDIEILETNPSSKEISIQLVYPSRNNSSGSSSSSSSSLTGANAKSQSSSASSSAASSSSSLNTSTTAATPKQPPRKSLTTFPAADHSHKLAPPPLNGETSVFRFKFLGYEAKKAMNNFTAALENEKRRLKEKQQADEEALARKLEEAAIAAEQEAAKQRFLDASMLTERVDSVGMVPVAVSVLDDLVAATGASEVNVNGMDGANVAMIDSNGEQVLVHQHHPVMDVDMNGLMLATGEDGVAMAIPATATSPNAYDEYLAVATSETMPVSALSVPVGVPLQVQVPVPVSVPMPTNGIMTQDMMMDHLSPTSFMSTYHLPQQSQQPHELQPDATMNGLVVTHDPSLAATGPIAPVVGVDDLLSHYVAHQQSMSNGSSNNSSSSSLMDNAFVQEMNMNGENGDGAQG